MCLLKSTIQELFMWCKRHIHDVLWLKYEADDTHSQLVEGYVTKMKKKVLQKKYYKYVFESGQNVAFHDCSYECKELTS